MSKKNVIIGATAAFALGAIAVYLVNKKKSKSKTRLLANEGYELASDILFPGQDLRSKKLKFGPVLPQ